VDMRYRRQVHILTVPVPLTGDGALDAATTEETIARFESLYEEKYGRESAYREAGIELVSFRLRGEGAVRKPEFRLEAVGGEDAAHAVVEHVRAWVEKAGALLEVPGYDFERLLPGNLVPGPAIVWTPITTLVLGPAQTARVDEYKNLIVTSARDG
jgi:N-methylhydantoinase A